MDRHRSGRGGAAGRQVIVLAIVGDPFVLDYIAVSIAVVPFPVNEYPCADDMAVGGEAVFFAADRGPAGTLDHGAVLAQIELAPAFENKPAGEHMAVLFIEVVPFAVVLDPAGEHVSVAFVKIVPLSGIPDPPGLVGAVRVLVIGLAVPGREFCGSSCADDRCLLSAGI